MSYRRLEQLDGLQWPCPTEDHPGSPLLHDRLWSDPIGGAPAPFMPVEFEPPVDTLSPDFPCVSRRGGGSTRSTPACRRAAIRLHLRFGETIDLAPEDGVSLGVAEGERVRIVSRRGAVDAPVRFDRGLRPGLAFMTMHFPDEVDTNLLTIDAADPKSGTAEFKASAVRIERL